MASSSSAAASASSQTPAGNPYMKPNVTVNLLTAAMQNQYVRCQRLQRELPEGYEGTLNEMATAQTNMNTRVEHLANPMSPGRDRDKKREIKELSERMRRVKARYDPLLTKVNAFRKEYTKYHQMAKAKAAKVALAAVQEGVKGDEWNK